MVVMRELPFAWKLWWGESVGKISEDIDRARPFWFYFANAFELALPWTPMWIAGIVLAVLRFRRPHDDQASERAHHASRAAPRVSIRLVRALRVPLLPLRREEGRVSPTDDGRANAAHHRRALAPDRVDHTRPLVSPDAVPRHAGGARLCTGRGRIWHCDGDARPADPQRSRRRIDRRLLADRFDSRGDFRKPRARRMAMANPSIGRVRVVDRGRCWLLQRESRQRPLAATLRRRAGTRRRRIAHTDLARDDSGRRIVLLVARHADCGFFIRRRPAPSS